MANTPLGQAMFGCAELGDASGIQSLLEAHSPEQIRTALSWRRKWQPCGQYRELDGRNALSVAASNSHVEVVESLLAYGALEIEASDLVDDTSDSDIEVHGGAIFNLSGSLFHAMKGGQVRCAEALLSAGAAAFCGRDRLLHALVHWNSRQSISPGVCASFVAALKGRIDFDAVDHDGQTALMVACSLGNFSMATSLLECGANPDVADHLGNTALTLITPSKIRHFGKLLSTYGLPVPVQPNSNLIKHFSG